MEVVCTLAAVLLVVLAVVLLIAALVSIAVALEGADNSPKRELGRAGWRSSKSPIAAGGRWTT